MANYLDLTHCREIEALVRSFTAKAEWPTWLLLLGVYAGWFGVLLASHWLGLWCSTLLLIPLACNMFGIPNDIAMQVVAVGFIIGVLQDSCETALNSSTDVLFTAAACQAEDERLANNALRG